jgi:transcriptional regulator with XRE-family HTH domain
MRPRLKQKLGLIIKGLRESHGWEQATLAEKAQTSATTISQIENGRTATNIDLLERIAAALGVDPVELLGGAPPGSTPRPRLTDAMFLVRDLAIAMEKGDLQAPVMQELRDILREYRQAGLVPPDPKTPGKK